MINVCFLKNQVNIYRKIYLTMKELKKDVIKIIKDSKMKNVLFKNFIETIKKYQLFIEINYNLDLDKN